MDTLKKTYSACVGKGGIKCYCCGKGTPSRDRRKIYRRAKRREKALALRDARREDPHLEKRPGRGIEDARCP